MESTNKLSDAASTPNDQQSVEAEIEQLRQELAIAQERLQAKEALLEAIRAGKLPELMQKSQANQTPISEA